MKHKRISEKQILQPAFTIITVIFSLICITPYIMVIIGSFTDESVLTTAGLGFFPEKWSVNAYQVLFADPERILTGYRTTILVTLIGTFLSLLINSMLAYVLSKKRLRYRGVLSFYCAFTMLFNGGMVSWYIVCVNYLHLYDTFWALVLPYLANAWYMFLLRNYFVSLPEEMFEAAAIDGAGDLRTFFMIALPLAVPALASVALFISLGYWNDWWLGIMLTESREIMPLQLLLRSIVSNTQFLAQRNVSAMGSAIKPPSEGLKYATTIVTIGPILILYPFVQKYFVKGLTVGSVKG